MECKATLSYVGTEALRKALRATASIHPTRWGDTEAMATAFGEVETSCRLSSARPSPSAAAATCPSLANALAFKLLLGVGSRGWLKGVSGAVSEESEPVATQS